MILRPIARQVFRAAEMTRAYPIRLQHPHKKLVYRLACPPERPDGGELTVTRWAAGPLAELAGAIAALPARDATRFEAAECFFQYEADPPGGDVLTWHMNFADARLFGFHGGPLLAQDELQVAEHPALGSLRDAMEDSDVPHMAPLTSEDGRRTPVLIRGVERRCRIATEPDAAAGRPAGLYGNRFARADADTVTRAVTPLVPPTITNLIAMEAPSYGRGLYTPSQIEDVLTNALTGYLAVRLETEAAGRREAVVHSGFWGCGAFGGNRTLMPLLQLVAAQMAGLSRLVFHTVDRDGTRDFRGALALHEALGGAGAGAIDRLIDELVARGFRWGESDGN
ncbi:MAG TPA: hypothetical protein VIF57_23780 [Polyangia bacterium]|jgi:hypothetical protein